MMFLALLISLGVVFQGVAMFRSGWLYGYGIGYFGPLARDGVWHEALVAQLKQAVPPQNPGFAGQVLTNYHYFYDLIIAEISKFSGITTPFLIYRFFPVVLSILLGVGTYLLAKKLFKDKSTSLLAVFLAFFGSSFGWVLGLIRHQPIGGESAFWANQPVSMNLNPPYAISLVILIFGTILLDKYLKKPRVSLGIVLALIFGTLIGFKAYAGAIAVGSLFLLTFKKVFIDKSFSILPVFIGASLIFGLVYFLVSRGASSLIMFQPFWLINTMIDAGDRVGIPNFTARRFAYLGSGKYFNLFVIETISFVIFFVGNLGTRIVGVLGLKKKYLESDIHLFVFFLMLTSFFPAVLFVQKGNPWNIVQFFYYFMFFAGLYAASAIKKFSVPLIILFVIVTPISSIATFRSWLYPNPVAFLSTDEHKALEFLSEQPAGTVLKRPFDESLRGNYKDPYPLAVYADNSYVSAGSKHPVYIEDAEQQIILNTGYEERLGEAKRFFIEKNITWSEKFLWDNKIKYVYLPKIYYLPMAEQEYPMKKIFENDSVNIYQVNP